MREVIIVGGGASGLIAAVICARNGKKVTILEHNDKIGRKLLATGNGKCNFTNEFQHREDYRGENPFFAWNLIKEYGSKEFLLFMESIGIYSKNRNGYYYPYSEQAACVVKALLYELECLKVTIKCREHVTEIKPLPDGGFQVRTETYQYESQKVILTCGGKAGEITGSDGSGYTLAEGLGHHITPLYPALVGLRTEDGSAKGLSGIRIKAEITLLIKDKRIAREAGEIQFTSYGISGIPVFQVSRYVGRADLGNEKAVALLKLLPDIETETLIGILQKQKEIHTQKKVVQILESFMDGRIADLLLPCSGLKKNVCIKELERTDLETLCDQIKQWKLPIAGSNSFERAQVCAGGVCTDEVDGITMESKFHKGLYFAGELLDVDGTCGGYNLQWAYTSGYIAGTNAAS